MKKLIKKTIRIILSPFVLPDLIRFRKLNKDSRFKLSLKDLYPQVRDKTFQTSFDRHYVYHLSWAARVLLELKPAKHIDISSSLFFSGIVSAFVPVEFYDYRPADLKLSNLTTGKADLNHLQFADNSITSLSCMHTVEHVGLGRYGDKIDPEGDKKAAAELARVLARGGHLLFVVPVGAEAKIEWNAHRIYSYAAALALFPDLKLVEFALIPEYGEHGGLVRNAPKESLGGEKYACGCFLFTK
jgi:SAM-dependent methyltransferase